MQANEYTEFLKKEEKRYIFSNMEPIQIYCYVKKKRKHKEYVEHAIIYVKWGMFLSSG